MDEQRAKVLVVVAGLVIFGGLVAYRSAAALREAREAQGGAGERGEKTQVTVEGKAPIAYAVKDIAQAHAPPALPAVRLASLTIRGGEAHLRETFALNGAHVEEGKRLKELGGNTVEHDALRESGPDLPLGQLETDGVAWLVYATEVPDPWRARLGERACWVSYVIPDSPAERGGLRAGDLLVDVGHRREGDAPVEGPCWMAKTMLAWPAGQPTPVTVIRDGRAVELTLTKAAGSRYGYNYGDLPVLPSGTRLAAEAAR